MARASQSRASTAACFELQTCSPGSCLPWKPAFSSQPSSDPRTPYFGVRHLDPAVETSSGFFLCLPGVSPALPGGPHPGPWPGKRAWGLGSSKPWPFCSLLDYSRLEWVSAFCEFRGFGRRAQCSPRGTSLIPAPGLPASQPPSSFGGGSALLETKRGQASGEAAGASSLLNRPSFSFLSLGADEAEGETGWGTGGGDGIRIHILPVGLTSVSPEAKPANPFLYLLCDWGVTA